jgi:hypothetical protein
VTQKYRFLYLPNRNENLCPHKHSSINVHRGFIHNSWRPESSSTDKWINNLRHVHSMLCFSTIRTVHNTWINKSQGHYAKWRKSATIDQSTWFNLYETLAKVKIRVIERRFVLAWASEWDTGLQRGTRKILIYWKCAAYWFCWYSHDCIYLSKFVTLHT